MKADYNEELSQVSTAAGEEVAALRKWAYKDKEKGSGDKVRNF
jgi:hypothetical protein